MKTHSYCRECKYLCFILAAAACTDLKLLLKINLAGVIPQNHCCSHENNICTNFLGSPDQVRVRIFTGKGGGGTCSGSAGASDAGAKHSEAAW